MRNRNRNGQTIVTPAAAYPVTLTEVKAQLRITSSDEDTFLNSLIEAATEYTEAYCSRSFIAQTWDMYLDTFPFCNTTPIEVPLPPLISVTSIQYYDSASTLQTWDSASYVVDTTKAVGLIYPDMNYAYPSTRIFRNSVIIRFVAGYADSGASPIDLADNVPMQIKQAILLLIGHLYENREMTTPGVMIQNVPMSYDALLANIKIWSFG